MASLNHQYSLAVDYVEQHGFLLVFPVKGKDHPRSLWSCLYPGEPMRWDWDHGADQRVIDLWYLRERLSSQKEIIYGKYYQGRATLFSKKIFKSLLCLEGQKDPMNFSMAARQILEALEMDSPLSTKQLKNVSELRGRMFESTFTKAMKELWNSFAIVAIGEIDDGAFPSLAHGATRVVFEDLWIEAKTLDPLEAYFNLLALEEFSLVEKALLADVSGD